jgi:hypothetical protein
MEVDPMDLRNLLDEPDGDAARAMGLRLAWAVLRLALAVLDAWGW